MRHYIYIYIYIVQPSGLNKEMIMLGLRKKFNVQPFNFIINFIIVTDFG